MTHREKLQPRKQRGEKRDPERIKNLPIVMLHPDQRLGAGKGRGGIPARGWEVQGLGTEEARQKQVTDGSSAYSTSTLVPKVSSPLQPGQARVWYMRGCQPTSALGTLRICWTFAFLLTDLPTISRSPTRELQRKLYCLCSFLCTHPSRQPLGRGWGAFRTAQSRGI